MDLVSQLRSIVAPGHVLSPAPAGYTTDWRGRSGGPLAALVRPASTDEVAAAVKACAAAGAAIIPIGGNTGLVGGTLAPTGTTRPTVGLSTERMTRCAVDSATRSVLAQAGAPIGQVAAAARQAGLGYGVDLAARDTATVGGTIATNAGGIHVCAHGPTRAQLLGIEAVLADGSVLSDLRGLPKDNTGYDLRDLIAGSEGTLAIITRALLRLHPLPDRVLVVAAVVPSLAQALATARRLHAAGRPQAVEVVDGASCQGAAADLELRAPLRPAAGQYLVLLELADAVEERVGDALPDVNQAAVGVAPSERELLWQLRERQTEWWAGLAGVLHKFDVSIPLGDLDRVVADLAAAAAGGGTVLRFGVFGHLMEGSLHLQVLTSAADPELDGRLLSLVADAGGSISAEHGIGRDKASLLGLCRSPAEIAAMRAVKHALDPTGILNPGAVLS